MSNIIMKAQRLSLIDRINNLPEPLTENILCLLPIKDAVKTSVLTKEWRSKWATIPNLVFDEDTFDVSTNENRNQLYILLKKCARCNINPRKWKCMRTREFLIKRCKFFYAIYHVLFHHRHYPILEFTLTMEANDSFDEIDRIIHFLSRNSYVKKLKLDLRSSCVKKSKDDLRDSPDGRYSLPLSVLSMQQLTDLTLHNSQIYFKPPFTTRLACLTSLYLEDVNIKIKTLLHLVSKCPLLKSFTLFIDPGNFFGHYDAPVAELFKCLPLIEHLSISYWAIECFDQGKLPQELPTSLVHLKYFFLDIMHIIGVYGLDFVLLVLRSSPNLEKLKLLIYPETIDWRSKVDYSDIWLSHLSEVEIENFSVLEFEMEFVKIILDRSPVLKTVRITIHSDLPKDLELEMSEALLCFPRASPGVAIIVKKGDRTVYNYATL